MDGSSPLFTRLRLVFDLVGRSGPVNMALDEILLVSAEDDAVLRIYDWAEPSVSFGYFEPARSARQVARGRQVVRRWTGGGIVEHGEDLTYSLCVPRSCPLAAIRSEESYRRIHAAVAVALAQSGVCVEHHAAPVSTGMGEFNSCFERPVLHDLLSDGQKVAGGAQRRSRAGLLHQGSIRAKFVGTEQLLSWKQAMRRELPRALAENHEVCEPTPRDLLEANVLASAKYATPAWTDRF